jgi:glutaredoxin
MKVFHRALIALTCTAALTSLLASPVKASSGCTVATRDRSALSVYDRPNGEFINALRFGRQVDIQNLDEDIQGRVWAKIAGYYEGKSRRWGWVLRRHLDCGNQASRKIVIVYGYMACPHTARMVEALAREGIPYLFKDTRDRNNAQESNQRAANAGLKQNAVPVVYINKNQWVRVGPRPGVVISEYRSN